MSEGEGRVFPLLNRRTPVLDRLRDDEGEEDSVMGAGRFAAQSVMKDGEDELEKRKEEAISSFKMGMADELGVAVSDLSEDLDDKVGGLLAGLTEGDALNEDALRQLGLSGEGEEEQEEETERKFGSG